MANVNDIKFKQLVANRVHYPRVDGYPMYKRVDGMMDTGGRTVAKTAKWEAQAGKCYTSPNNIKRVFITKKGVGIDLYQHMVGGKYVHLFTAFPPDVTAAFEAVKLGVYGQGPRVARVSGTGLTCIEAPWVCSNIEEIYFDDSVLWSDEVLNSGMGDLFNIMGPNVGSGRGDLVQLIATRFGFASGDEGSMEKKYPRLKYVGYIGNLYEVYTAWVKACKADTNNQSLDRLIEKFSEHPVVASAFQNPGIATHLWTLDRPRLNGEYSLRSGIYCFDAEVLENYFRAYSQKILALARAKRDKAKESGTESESSEAVKSVIERQLDAIYANDGDEILRQTLAIIFIHATKQEQIEAYREMSPMGRKRYGKYMNIPSEELE